MFEQTLSDDTKSNLAAIASTPLSSQFYLAGGTALGLICQKAFPLEQSMAYYFDKFSDFNISRVHVFKSLVYFEDADQDEMPDMIQPVKWADVKKYFTSETNRLARTMLD